MVDVVCEFILSRPWTFRWSNLPGHTVDALTTLEQALSGDMSKTIHAWRGREGRSSEGRARGGHVKQGVVFFLEERGRDWFYMGFYTGSW